VRALTLQALLTTTRGRELARALVSALLTHEAAKREASAVREPDSPSYGVCP
jgi:hypothetical protein